VSEHRDTDSGGLRWIWLATWWTPWCEGRSYREVAAAHGVSKSYVGKLVGRFRQGGYGAIEPRSRAAKRIPHRTPDGIEDAIVALRKELADLGLDAGAQTIH
jgi:hypothetical protein